MILSKPPQTVHNQTVHPAIGQTAYEIVGPGHHLDHIAVIGGLYGLKLSGGADDIVIDTFKASGITGSGYPGYTGKNLQGVWNKRPNWKNMQFIVEPFGHAMHALRAYCLEQFYFENVVCMNFGPYHGAAMLLKAIREGIDPKNPKNILPSIVQGGREYGRPGSVGPNATDADPNYTCTNIIFRDRIFDMNGDWRDAGFTQEGTEDMPTNFLSQWSEASPYLISPGCVNILYQRCTFIQHNMKKAVIRCNKSDGIHADVKNVVMDTCQLQGGNKKIDGTNPGGVKFISSH